jgi:hypothetical protein
MNSLVSRQMMVDSRGIFLKGARRAGADVEFVPQQLTARRGGWWRSKLTARRGSWCARGAFLG